MNEKTSNEGVIAPLIFTIMSAMLCYGLADKIYGYKINKPLPKDSLLTFDILSSK